MGNRSVWTALILQKILEFVIGARACGAALFPWSHQGEDVCVVVAIKKLSRCPQLRCAKGCTNTGEIRMAAGLGAWYFGGSKTLILPGLVKRCRAVDSAQAGSDETRFR